MKNANKVVLIISQIIAASVTGKGKYTEDFEVKAEFETESKGEINSHNLGLWLYGNVIKHMQLMKAQKLETFRQNKPCVVTVKVNNKEESIKMKFSLRLDVIMENLSKYPELLGKLFTPIPSIGGISAKDIQKLVNGDKVVIAKSIRQLEKESKVIEIAAAEEVLPRLSLDNVELTESDLQAIK